MSAWGKHITETLRTYVQVFKCVLGYRWKNISYPDNYGQPEARTQIRNSLQQEQREPLPKVVWIYWHQVDLPPLIASIIAHNKRKLVGYEFRVLNSETLHEYLPEQQFRHDTLLAHRADLIRLELLARYGGIWLDAALVLGEDLGWVEEIAHEEIYDLIGYYSERNTRDKGFPVIETWFLACPAGNPFICAWRDEFSKIKFLGSEGYYRLLAGRQDYQTIMQRISRPSYLMLNLAEQIVSRGPVGINAYLKRCEDSAFYVQECLGWDNYAINYAFTQRPVPAAGYSLVKLTAGDRMLVGTMSRLGLLNKKSLIGQLMFAGAKASFTI